MRKFVSHFVTTVKHPAIGLEYADWAFKKAFRTGVPVRDVHGVRLGDFNSFSEYHTVTSAISRSEMTFIETHAFGAGVIIDVGANLGLFSLVFSKRFPDRRIIAFEPSPSTFLALKNNVARNYVRNIEPHPIVVAANDGTLAFNVRENSRANASIHTESSNQSGSVMELPCITLDTFCKTNGVDQIALLKVDVEGFELNVFRGAERVISFVRPSAIYFEICPVLARSVGFDPAAAASYIAAHGYNLYRPSDRGRLEPIDACAASSVTGVENWIGIDSR